MLYKCNTLLYNDSRIFYSLPAGARLIRRAVRQRLQFYAESGVIGGFVYE